MKLWEIKAQALRLMFADSDIQFNKEEFENGSLMSNANTREKLVLMNASIKRAIDLYYKFNEAHTRFSEEPTLRSITPEGQSTVYYNEIILGDYSNINYPLRVDVKVYQSGVLVGLKNNVGFVYDELSQRKISFIDEDYTALYANDYTLVFRVWYKQNRGNLPETPNDLTYDLDAISIPSEVQTMIPYFIKAELYEEDEPTLAQQARSNYIQYVSSIRRQFSGIQTKVKRANVFNK